MDCPLSTVPAFFQLLPFHVSTLPDEVTAAHRLAEAQLTQLSPLLEILLAPSHCVPFHCTASPPWSTSMQKLRLAHDTRELKPSFEVATSSPDDHEFPFHAVVASRSPAARQKLSPDHETEYSESRY